jgi:molecular chaperone GrpE
VKTKTEDRLEAINKLLEEIADDNTHLVGSLNRVLEAQDAFRGHFVRELDQLRKEVSGSLVFGVVKDLCREVIPPLNAMEAMLLGAEFSDSETIRSHVNSLAITLRAVLARMGVERISVAPGEEVFDPSKHLCVGLRSPVESPFPRAPARTIVRVVEDGYLLGSRVLSPAKVEVLTDQPGAAAAE